MHFVCIVDDGADDADDDDNNVGTCGNKKILYFD